MGIETTSTDILFVTTIRIMSLATHAKNLGILADFGVGDVED